MFFLHNSFYIWNLLHSLCRHDDKFQVLVFFVFFFKSLESLYLFLIVLLFFLILSLSSLLRSVVCFSLLLRSFQKDIRIYLPELAKIIVLPLFLWLPSLCQWDLNLTKLFPVTLIQYASFTLGHQFLHFFSIKSWSNWKCNDTFGICLL